MKWNGMEQRIVYKQRLINFEIWFVYIPSDDVRIQQFLSLFFSLQNVGSQKALSLRSIRWITVIFDFNLQSLWNDY